MPGAPARRRAGPHRGAGRASSAPGRSRRARRAGSSFQGAGISFCHARPGRVSLRQPECPCAPGTQTPLRKPAMTTHESSRKSATLEPLAAAKALDAHFLEARCKLLDLAAILDRINRGQPGDKLAGDPRLEKIHQALEVLLDPSG